MTAQPSPAAPYPGLLDELEAAAAALRAPAEAIDGAFVSVGGRLAECATILGAITRMFEALPADLQSAELAEATDRLAIVGRRATEISLALAEEQANLARLVTVVGGAGHPISDLRRTVKMMSIVAINARVVAAGVVDEMTDFEVFTTDIAQLSDSATATIATFSRTYVTLVDAVREAAETRGRFETTHRDTLSALAADLERGLEAVTRHRHRSVEASAETGRMSRAIADRVGATVMALQVGDATRQRVEHVEAALRDLGNSPDAELVPPVTELQRQQVVAARETLIEEMAAGEAALRQLARDAMAVLDHTRSVYGGDNGQSSLGGLNRALRDAVKVLRDCEAEREKLDRVAVTVASTVRILLDHVEAVQDIEYKMRLVSLNAAVKCAQLGPRGRALDVIAQQLRALTGETVTSAHAAVEKLNQAASFAAAFTASAGGATSNRVGDLEREATVALGQLETVAERMKRALNELHRDGPVVARRLDEAADDLADNAAISEALEDAEMLLAAFASAETPELMRLARAEPAAGFLAGLRRRYTMDTERRVHDAFAGAPLREITAAPEPEPESAEAALDDLLF